MGNVCSGRCILATSHFTIYSSLIHTYYRGWRKWAFAGYKTTIAKSDYNERCMFMDACLILFQLWFSTPGSARRCTLCLAYLPIQIMSLLAERSENRTDCVCQERRTERAVPWVPRNEVKKIRSDSIKVTRIYSDQPVEVDSVLTNKHSLIRSLKTCWWCWLWVDDRIGSEK